MVRLRLGPNSKALGTARKQEGLRKGSDMAACCDLGPTFHRFSTVFHCSFLGVMTLHLSVLQLLHKDCLVSEQNKHPTLILGIDSGGVPTGREGLRPWWHASRIHWQQSCKLGKMRISAYNNA